MHRIGEDEGVPRGVPVGELVARLEAGDAQRRGVGYNPSEVLLRGAPAQRVEQPLGDT